MKIWHSLFLTVAGIFLLQSAVAQSALDNYVDQFDYQSRKSMKVSSEEITGLLINDEAILLDIRFKKEHLAWGLDYAVRIPLNELPHRLAELPLNKRIITACPHKDRAIIAMLYLKSKGYKTGYLKDGLLGLMEHLRGDNARIFIENYKN